MRKRTAVIGAGVGGLATAARLAHLGYEVDVFEKLPVCGGRANIIEDGGFKFDTGPSFVLMPEFFREIFDYCGESIESYLDMMLLDISYKIFFADGETFTVSKDTESTKKEMERIEPGSAKGFDSFIEYSGDIYKAVKPLLSECLSMGTLLDPKYLGLLGKIHPFTTFWKAARKFFKSEKLCYAFTFESMFMGVSPFKTPAFYSVITYSDHVEKIFHPRGGMYMIPKAIEAMAKKKGARFHYGREVKSVRKREGKLYLSTKDDVGEFDIAVANADLPHAKRDILGLRIPKYKYSCSVFLMYMGMKKKIRGLEHHNLFFAKDLPANIKHIFNTGIITDDPSFYVHVPTVTDSSLAPEGKDILYTLIPVPNLFKNPAGVKGKEKVLRKIVIDKLGQITGEDIESLIETEHRFYPDDFTARYNIINGATFGLAHNLTQSAFFRPPNFEPAMKGFYYAGASTQPGGGLPVVLASSLAATKLIERYLGG